MRILTAFMLLCAGAAHAGALAPVDTVVAGNPLMSGADMLATRPWEGDDSEENDDGE